MSPETLYKKKLQQKYEIYETIFYSSLHLKVSTHVNASLTSM